MHVDTGWGRPETPDWEAAPAPVRRAAAYCGTLAEDKELLAIFERTYGPIRRKGGSDARRAFAPAQKPAQPKTPAAPAPSGPEYLLVDGYNIVYAWPALAALAAENLDAARCRLLDELCNYQGYRGADKCRVIVVFDAYKVKGSPGVPVPYHNITVVYTKEAETADTYIERVTHEIGRQHRVRVATGDGAEQYIILGNGALRLTAKGLRQELDAVDKDIRDWLAGADEG